MHRKLFALTALVVAFLSSSSVALAQPQIDRRALPPQVCNAREITTLTISSGSVTVTQCQHLIDTEGSASSDALTTVVPWSGIVAGQTVELSTLNAARDVTIQNGSGSNLIATPDGDDYLLDILEKTAKLRWTGSQWRLLLSGGDVTKSLLASTTTGEGASLIGIEDAAANYAAGNVEDALAEVYDAVGAGSSTLRVADYAALAGLSYATLTNDQLVFVADEFRGGAFVWDSSDLSAEVTADPDQCFYVAPTAAATGASGAYRRKEADNSGYVKPSWCGAVGDMVYQQGTASLSGTTLTNSGAIFSAGDVGKTVAIAFAGDVGFADWLVTTITGYTSATQVTVADAGTASSVDMHFGTDDHDAFQAAVDTCRSVELDLNRYLLNGAITSCGSSQGFYGKRIPFGLVPTGATVLFVNNGDGFYITHGAVSFQNFRIKTLRVVDAAAIRFQRTANTDDGDSYVNHMVFDNFYYGVEHFGRGINVQNNWFQVGDVALYHTWPLSGTSGDENHLPPFGDRAHVFSGNRVHSVNIAVQTAGDTRHQVRGLRINNNLIDLGNALFYGGLINSEMVGNIVEMSSDTIITCDAGCDNLIIANNVLKGKESGASPGTESPPSAISLTGITGGIGDSTLRGVVITGNVIANTDANAIEFHSNVSGLVMTDNYIEDWDRGATATYYAAYWSGDIENSNISNNRLRFTGGAGYFLQGDSRVFSESFMTGNVTNSPGPVLYSGTPGTRERQVVIQEEAIGVGDLDAASAPLHIKVPESPQVILDRTGSALGVGVSSVDDDGNFTFTLNPSGTDTGELVAGVDNGVNIGSASVRMANGYFATSLRAGTAPSGTARTINSAGSAQLALKLERTTAGAVGIEFYNTAGTVNISCQPTGAGVGSCYPGTDNGIDLGLSSAAAWKDIYLDGYLMQTTAITPASAAAACTTGAITHDASYIYVCTATNTWKRAAISTW